MKLVTFSAIALAIASFANAVTYPIIPAKANCRSSPNISASVKRVYKKGNRVSISCQTIGTSVSGNKIWDKTSDGCYVPDYHVNTGSSDFFTKICPSTAPVPGAVQDDYPYNTCIGIDAWGFSKCQCVSFVAWRINRRLGIKFNNRYKGAVWGNGNTWNEAARKVGIRVDNKPVPGCIAQTDNGGRGAGHVAWVTKVSGNKVTVEEYNFNKVKGYGKRTVKKNTFRYIHIKV